MTPSGCITEASLAARDAAFRKAFRRVGGILPRVPGSNNIYEALWRIINDRRIGLRLHPNTRIVAARAPKQS